MHIFSLFEHSRLLEQALIHLEQAGIPKSNILVVPLAYSKPIHTFWSISKEITLKNLFDCATVFGTVGTILGAIFGFILTWGPILWGLIGLFSGILFGLVFARLFLKKTNTLLPFPGLSATLLLLIIHCEDLEETLTDNILNQYSPLLSGRVRLEKPGT